MIEHITQSCYTTEELTLCQSVPIHILFKLPCSLQQIFLNVFSILHFSTLPSYFQWLWLENQSYDPAIIGPLFSSCVEETKTKIKKNICNSFLYFFTRAIFDMVKYLPQTCFINFLIVSYKYQIFINYYTEYVYHFNIYFSHHCLLTIYMTSPT